MTRPTLPINATRQERLRREHRLSWRRLLAAYLYDVRTLLFETRIALTGFMLVMIVSTLYLRYGYTSRQYHSLIAAAYDTLQLLTLQSGLDFPTDPLGQCLFFAIPIFGLAFVFQSVLDFGRRLLDKGSRIEDWQLSLAQTYKGHIILCGLGRISYRVMLQLLDAGYDVVVIEKNWNSEFVPDALTLHVPVIQGDARNAEVLQRAGLERARALGIATSNDLLNIEIALAARRSHPTIHTVLRIFHEKLDYNLERSTFGTNTAFSSSALAAPTLAAASVCRGITYALPLPDGLLGIAELTVTAGGKLDTLIYKIEEEFHVRVVSYTGRESGQHSCWRHRIRPTTRLYGGDRVLLMGTLHALSEAWRHGQTRNKIMATLGMDLPQRLIPYYNRVIVCGLGKIGYRVVKVLHQMEPRPDIVVIYYENTREIFLKEIQDLGITVIPGDARRDDVLRSAGVARAYSVVAVTSDHLTNLQIGLAARYIRSDIHLVLRVFSDVLADQLEGMFGIHTTFSTSALAAPTLSAATVVPGTGYAIDIGDRLVSTARWTVQFGDEFAGKSINELREYYGIVVIALQHDAQFLFLTRDPHQPDQLFERSLATGDEIMLLADIHTVANLRQRGAQPGITNARITRRLPPLPELPADAAPVPPPEPQTPPMRNSQSSSEDLLERLLRQ